MSAAPPKPSRPWLSVIMPAYRGERWLGLALDSLVAQTRAGFEVILIDGSPDEATRAIAQRYHDRLALRIETRPDLLTWQAKTNHGATLASADHLAMLHCDDLWLPDRASRLHDWLTAAPDVTMHLHPSFIVDARGGRLGLWRCPLAEGLVASDALLERLIVQNFIAICGSAIRRDHFLDVGGVDDALWYTADWDLYLKLAERGDVVVRPQATTAFRIHGNSLTMTGSRDEGALREQLETVLKRHGEAFGIDQDSRLRARALASVDINCGLARGAAGQKSWVWPTVSRFLRLGPVDAWRYVHESRIADRALPRLRARLSGAL